jgi:hypothetical protein
MISNNWWKIEIHDGIELAYLFGTITLQERKILENSIDDKIDEERMNEDTWRRLNRKG